MLKVSRIKSGYEDIEVLHGLDFSVEEGSIVTIIGSNGAGKTTTIRTLAGLNPVLAGEIHFLGTPVHTLASHERVEQGMVMVPEGRRLFPSMTVLENLQLGAYHQEAEARLEKTLSEVYELFPRVKERSEQKAGTLSGGEQQMVAIGRGLMSLPKLLMLDEPSLGLAPLVVQQIFEMILEVRRRGTTVLIVEQNVQRSLSISDYGWVMENGEISIRGSGQELLSDPNVKKAYLGL